MLATNRRRFLQGLSLLAGTAAGGVGIAGATPRQPTRKELEFYYGLLWMEFANLSEELGVEMHDAYTVHKDGKYEVLKAALEGAPSSRALAVLALANVRTDQ